MAYRLRLLLFPILFISSLNVHAAIQAVVSHTVFYMPDTAGNAKNDKPYAEVYWQVDPHTLHFIRNEKGEIFATIKTDIVFSNEQGIVGQDHFVLETDHFISVNDVLAHSIIEMRRYIMPPGAINMRLTLTDIADTARHFIYTDSFSVAAPDDNAFYSDMQLLDTAYISDARNTFQKNGFLQIPLCANFYDENRNRLRYYFELYGANKVSKDDYPLVERVFISNKVKEGVFTKLVKTDTIAAMGFQYSLGSFPIQTIGSGNYYVNVTLENNLRVIIASKSLLFQRFNANPVIEKEDSIAAKKAAKAEDVTILDLSKTFIAKYSSEQLRLILKMMIPVADPEEIQAIQGFLKKPDDIYTRYFVYNFFSAINKADPEMAWKEFTNRVREVNRLYSIGGTYDKKGKMTKSFTTPGYATDRGFIYLRYGKPNEMVNEENETGTYPYQVWQYNTLVQMNKKKLTNAVFLFYKPTEMLDDYRLLHSTVPGEAQNKSWRTYLHMDNGGGTVSTNSQAEQYIGNR